MCLFWFRHNWKRNEITFWHPYGKGDTIVEQIHEQHLWAVEQAWQHRARRWPVPGSGKAGQDLFKPPPSGSLSIGSRDFSVHSQVLTFLRSIFINIEKMHRSEMDIMKPKKFRNFWKFRNWVFNNTVQTPSILGITQGLRTRSVFSILF